MTGQKYQMGNIRMREHSHSTATRCTEERTSRIPKTNLLVPQHQAAVQPGWKPQRARGGRQWVTNPARFIRFSRRMLMHA